MKHPIVFIHGSGDSSRIWRLQFELAHHTQRGSLCLSGTAGGGKPGSGRVVAAALTPLDAQYQLMLQYTQHILFEALFSR